MELLTVLAIVALVGTFTAPLVAQLVLGEKFSQAIDQISGSLDRAHEYAVANGSYTYVALTEPDAQGRVSIATFGANDASSGITSLTSPGAYTVVSSSSAPSGALVLLDRIARVQGCELEDTLPAVSPLSSLGALSASTSPFLSTTSGSGPQFSYTDPVNGTLNFTRVVQFTPDGEARVVPATPDSVQLVVVPTRGAPTAPVAVPANAAAIRIAGLTGQVTVYQP